jgi:hypothetical protein
MPDLVRDLVDHEVVVFHCMLSQQRGPKAAVRYNIDRERHVAKFKGKNLDQKIYVLDKGFSGWAKEFGGDARLSTNVRKEVWDSYHY